jgi:enoyl-CoA hydratase
MSYETIQIEREREGDGTVLTITLNRPEVRNAIDRRMIHEIASELGDAALDPEVRVIIFTGAGNKSFAAGADIAELKDRGVLEALERINAGLFKRIEEHPVPTIAAICGYALGGGCELAMACDIRIAGESAKLGQPEVGLGIIPGAGAIQRMPRLIGLGRAKELILTGRIVDAKEAEQIGLVNRVVPDAEVLLDAKATARKIAEQGPLAIKVAKAALNASAGGSSASDALDALGQAILFESSDKHQRMAAFLERRRSHPPPKGSGQASEARRPRSGQSEDEAEEHPSEGTADQIRHAREGGEKP